MNSIVIESKDLVFGGLLQGTRTSNIIQVTFYDSNGKTQQVKNDFTKDRF